MQDDAGELGKEVRHARHRYSISVTRETYDRLRAAVAPGSLSRVVDEIIRNTLDDPGAAARVVAWCRQVGERL